MLGYWIKYVIVILFCGLTLICDSFGQVTVELLVHYQFEGHSLDISGNENHGTTNDIQFVEDRFGNRLSAASFNGSSSAILVPSTELLIDEYTYTLWVKPISIPNPQETQFIFSIGQTGGDQTIQLCNQAGGNRDLTGWYGGGYSEDRSIIRITSDALPELDEWVQLVLLRSKSYLKFYVNCNLIDSLPLDQNPYYGDITNSNAVLGSRFDNSSSFQGVIDDFRIFKGIVPIEDLQSETMTSELYSGCSGDGYSVEVNGKIYDEQNPVGTEVIKSMIGCDSIINIELQFSSTDTTILDTVVCDNDYLITVDGVSYDINNAFGTETLTNIFGCDSIVMINLFFNQTGVSFIEEVLCPGEFIEINGQTFDNLNPMGSIVLRSNVGCDSIIEVDITYYPESRYTVTIDTTVLRGQGQINILEEELITSIRWDSDLLSCSDCPNPVIQSTEGEVINGSITDIYGCVYDISIPFSLNINIYIPNIMDPESRIGNNRLSPVLPFGLNYKYNMDVFDRWGGLVYQVKDEGGGNDLHGWDGYINGNPVNPGVYTYLLEIYIQDNTEAIYKTGTVTVL